jgi:hypothetical protein
MVYIVPIKGSIFIHRKVLSDNRIMILNIVNYIGCVEPDKNESEKMSTRHSQCSVFASLWAIRSRHTTVNPFKNILKYILVTF